MAKQSRLAGFGLERYQALRRRWKNPRRLQADCRRQTPPQGRLLQHRRPEQRQQCSSALPASAQYKRCRVAERNTHPQDEPVRSLNREEYPSKLIATMTVQKPSIWTQKNSADGRATVDAAAYATAHTPGNH